MDADPSVEGHSHVGFNKLYGTNMSVSSVPVTGKVETSKAPNTLPEDPWVHSVRGRSINDTTHWNQAAKKL